MNPVAQIAILLVQTLGGFYGLLLMLRFLLQVARADFYNPVSQFIAKATNPVLLPLRRVVPGFFGIDLACLLLVLLVQFLTLQLSVLLAGHWLNPLWVLVASALNVVATAIQVYFVCMLVMIVLSFVAPHTRHPAGVLAIQLVQPLSAPFQRMLPAMGGLDFSPVFVFLVLKVARILVDAAAAATGTTPLISHLFGGF